MTSTLEELRAQTDMTDVEWAELVEMVLRRANGPVPTSTPDICGALSELQSDHQAITGLSAWMTRGDLARALGVPLDHVKKWHARGKLPTPDEMVGNRAVWSRRTVKLWAQELTRLANGGT